MPKELPQITFDFSEGPKDEPAKEFLSGHPVPAPQPKVKSARGRRPLKELEAEAEHVEVPEDEVLFAKQYWGISEVAAMFKVNISLIRYWENEFDILEPRKNRKGDRLFKPTDVKNLQLIHDLIRRRKFTVEGAKDYIRHNKKAQELHQMVASLKKIRSFLLEVKANL